MRIFIKTKITNNIMDVAQVKNDLHRMVVETDDIGLLNKVKQIFDILKADNTDWADALSPEIKELRQSPIIN